MRKIYTKTFVYFAEIQYIYNAVSYTHLTLPTILLV